MGSRERICRQVTRLRPLFTGLLLAAWIPIHCPWAGPLAILAHEAHEASLNWSHGHLHVVLEHSQTWSYAPEDTILPAAHAGQHADHVLHPFAPDQFLRATPTDVSAHAAVCWFTLSCSEWPAASAQSPVQWRAHAPPRSSPTLDSLRTTILVV